MAIKLYQDDDRKIIEAKLREFFHSTGSLDMTCRGCVVLSILASHTAELSKESQVSFKNAVGALFKGAGSPEWDRWLEKEFPPITLEKKKDS
jgi:hypothetical protein